MIGDVIFWIKNIATKVKDNWKRFLKENLFCIHDYEIKRVQSLWTGYEVLTCTKCGRVKTKTD